MPTLASWQWIALGAAAILLVVPRLVDLSAVWAWLKGLFIHTPVAVVDNRNSLIAAYDLLYANLPEARQVLLGNVWPYLGKSQPDPVPADPNVKHYDVEVKL